MTARYAASVTALLAVVGICAQAAEPYPQRPIRFLVPQSPGGASDTVARVVAQRLGERLGQQLVVDNRPGATRWSRRRPATAIRCC